MFQLFVHPDGQCCTLYKCNYNDRKKTQKKIRFQSQILSSLQYGTSCYCGDWTDSEHEFVSEELCVVACGGDPNKSCGGNSQLDLYKYH